MASPFEDLAMLDKLVHEPARLAILTALQTAQTLEFLHLQQLINLSKGNLSTHLARLEEANLIVIDKHFEGKKPVTQIQLTAQGKQAIREHWRRLDELRHMADVWPGE
jgi:DNA-binding MarR family transcriptional regulator